MARDCRGNTCLHYAAASGCQDTIAALLGAGLSVDVINTDHVTPLHVATYHGRLDAVEQLLKSGADVSATTGAGCNVFHLLATGAQCVRVGGALLGMWPRGLSATDDEKNLPLDTLMCGIKPGCEAFLLWLLRSGARGRLGRLLGSSRVRWEGLEESERQDLVSYFIRDAMGDVGMLRKWLDLAWK